MKNTQFHSVHGLPPGKDQLPDVSTARDIATLSQALLKYPEVLKYTSVKERAFRPDSSKPFIMRNHNHLLGEFEGADGLKTGYFFNGGFSIAATASKKGSRVIAVVMGSVNRKVRDSAAKEIISKTLMELIRTSPVPVASPRKSESALVKEAPDKSQSPAETVSNSGRIEAAGKEDGYYTIRISKSFIKILGGIFVGIIFLLTIFSIGRRKKMI
jgi:D-alanyl-D-alanine carboxypeptidase (penicillin-binding protein 5/6)